MWLIAALAAVDSVIPAKILFQMLVYGPGGQVPGMAILVVLVWGTLGLAVIWSLAAIAAWFRGRITRIVVLVLLLLPFPSEISALIDSIENRMPTPDAERTGRAYFDTQPDRDLAAAIWACDPRNRVDGAVCDLDKLRALARVTDTGKVGPGGVSNMGLTLTNHPNPDVVRIVLRGGKPPKDIAQDALYRARESLPLLHAVLDGGVDPNTLDQAGMPFIFWTITRNNPIEELTAYLDAGARVDAVDREGYTPLMRAVYFQAFDKAEMLLARGAAEDHVAADGTTLDTLIAALPPLETEMLPNAVRGLMDRHRRQ